MGGDAVVPVVVVIAPGSGHVPIRGVPGPWRVEVEQGPHLEGSRRSADALFHSAAWAAGSLAVGVLLTGIGSDGSRGLLALRRAGAATLAQDRATSVAYGMPGAAAALGAAGQVLPFPSIAAAVLRHGGGTGRAAAS